MRATVVRRCSFAAAHYLPHYKGKCANLHGHSFVIEVGVSGEVDSESGMVVDFGELKGVLQPILDNLDHHCINTVLENPTAENIALYVLNWLSNNWEIRKDMHIEFIRLWETEDSYAEVKG